MSYLSSIQSTTDSIISDPHLRDYFVSAPLAKTLMEQKENITSLKKPIIVLVVSTIGLLGSLLLFYLGPRLFPQTNSLTFRVMGGVLSGFSGLLILMGMILFKCRFNQRQIDKKMLWDTRFEIDDYLQKTVKEFVKENNEKETLWVGFKYWQRDDLLTYYFTNGKSYKIFAEGHENGCFENGERFVDFAKFVKDVIKGNV